MSVTLNPDLNCRGEARKAMDFYKSVFGGELTRMTFADGGMPVDDAEKDNVMHSQLMADGQTLMGSDVPSHMTGEIANGTVSLSGDDDAKLRGWWSGLADGASVSQELTTAPWGDTFGMLTDRFGVSWLMNIAGSQNG